MAFATDAWLAACRWCSTRTTSSAVVCRAARCSSTEVRHAACRRSYSRARCSNCTTKAECSCGASGDEACSGSASMRARCASAARRAFRADSISSASRRRFSMRASFSMLGQAQSSPIVKRGDPLVAAEELRELLGVEPAVAVTDQLDGDGVDTGLARVLPHGERRQLAVIRGREVPADLDDLRRDQVKVVEQPLGAGGDELPRVEILGQHAVGVAQGPGVVVKAGKDAACAAPGISVDGEARCQCQGACFETLDTEELVAERPFPSRGWTTSEAWKQAGPPNLNALVRPRYSSAVRKAGHGKYSADSSRLEDRAPSIANSQLPTLIRAPNSQRVAPARSLAARWESAHASRWELGARIRLGVGS